MTEQSNAELAHDIGMDAIDWDMVRDGVGDPEEAASIAVRAALEAAEQRAEEAERERDNWKMSAEEAERAEKHWERRAHIAEQRAEEAERERDRLDEAFDRDLPWRYDEVEAQRNQLAAVVEKALSHDPLHGADSGLYCGGMAPCIRDILATAPADALREVKADVWDEGEEAGMKNQANWDGWRDTKPPITNPYRAREEQS